VVLVALRAAYPRYEAIVTESLHLPVADPVTTFFDLIEQAPDAFQLCVPPEVVEKSDFVA